MKKRFLTNMLITQKTEKHTMALMAHFALLEFIMRTSYLSLRL